MNTNRDLLGMVAAAAIVAMACTTGGHFRIALHDRDDPSPQRLEIAAQVAGLCVSFLMSWSKDATQAASRY